MKKFNNGRSVNIMSTKQFNCPFCKKKYVNKLGLYNHMEDNHEEDFGGLSAAQTYFNLKYNKTTGKCIMCGNDTSWNPSTEKYERIDSEKCKDKYREMFRKRMLQRYGKDTLLDSPEHQKKMQQGRRIAGKYTWSNGAKFDYLGSYEEHALEFLDKVLKLDSNEVITPAPIALRYVFDGKTHFYMPDFYIVSLDLLIEVKGTNNHYQKRDKAKEDAKDKASEKSKHNFVKIVDKQYDDLLEIIDKIKNRDDDSDKTFNVF